MSGTAFVVALVIAYPAGRFIERAWPAWSVAALTVMGPLVAWSMTSGLLTGKDEGGFGVALFLVASLVSLGKLGVALFCCLLGRSHRFDA